MPELVPEVRKATPYEPESVGMLTPPLVPLARDTTKVLVAVHGIGDQTAYATVQSVALRVSTHQGRMIAMPLGRFYRSSQNGASSLVEATPQLMSKDDGSELENIVLAESYWAPIPREVAEKKFVLEDAKGWARSIAARVSYSGKAGGWPKEKVERLVVVLDELVETIRILERLSFLAEKAGVFKFDLARLLVDFVGDVQLVADFPRYRGKIIERFDETMRASLAVAPKNTKNELYIIAHSEGTVITFLALLEALNDPDRYTWIKNVCGLMTIGSPIEVHHLLWPGLWQYGYRDGNLKPSAGFESHRGIPWHNYMDYGDPIAYELTETKAWLRETGFGRHLIPETHAFSRYPLPGKAHVDYWSDDDVFGHFFETVVGIPRKETSKLKQWDENITRVNHWLTSGNGSVRTSLWVPTFTFILPYTLVAALLFAGVYSLEHGVASALHVDYSVTRLTHDVLGIGALMFGITAAVRLPRIADSFKWTIAGGGILFASMVLFSILTTPGTQREMGGQLAQFFGLSPSQCTAVAVGVSMGCEGGAAGLASHTFVIWIVAALVTLAASYSTKRFPQRGHYILPAFGIVAALFIVFTIARTESPTGASATPSLWPLLIGGLAFFYLWWLAGMLFDLAFIWRHYTRDAGIEKHLAKLATAAAATQAS